MMSDRNLDAPDWLIRWEQALVVAACAMALAAFPLVMGRISISWDALNHHVYLGWVAEHARFDRDYLAASYQAYQYPYLYWPVYKLALGGASGAFAGVVLAQLHVLAAPAAWRLARACIPGREWFQVALRALGVALAFSSGVILSMFDSTANDFLAAIPLLWAFAIALEPVAASEADRHVLRKAACISGLLAGLSVAFKFSNGPVAILMPLLWLWPGRGLGARLTVLVQGGLCTIAGFVVAYGWWGWQLWAHLGNPFYPFFDGWFEPLRQLTGWTRDSI